MQTYIATLWARHGTEGDVTRFYQDMDEQMRAAPGFRGRQIFRAQPGRLLEIVKNYISEEELATASERGHAEGVHFVIIEQWDDAENRVEFSRSLDKARAAKLYPNLLEQHTHEFYEDVTDKV